MIEMNFVKEEKAQAGLETLLLIAGAILVATIVGLYLKSGIAGQGIQQKIEEQKGQAVEALK
ncbi:hypothetical protein HZB89_01500 [archaeon]|nr:hypothetical protein [archaeon]